MRSRFALIAMLVIVVTLPSFVGCGPTPASHDSVGEAQLKVLGILYGKFLSSTRGQAPKDQAQFVEYLNSKRPSWEKIVESADQLLKSPRDGKPLVIAYGKAYEKQRSAGTFWMAYEQDGIEGKHQVISIRGSVEAMDSEQVQSLFSE